MNFLLDCSGYMSPEYAMQGLFSDKSDVFSFGVLILEIISGKKNNSYYDDVSVTLIGHVNAMLWQLQEKKTNKSHFPFISIMYVM